MQKENRTIYELLADFEARFISQLTFRSEPQDEPIVEFKEINDAASILNELRYSLETYADLVDDNRLKRIFELIGKDSALYQYAVHDFSFDKLEEDKTPMGKPGVDEGDNLSGIQKVGEYSASSIKDTAEFELLELDELLSKLKLIV